jgi:hypothetical protein
VTSRPDGKTDVENIVVRHGKNFKGHSGATRPFGDVGLVDALAVDLEVVVGAVSWSRLVVMAPAS